MTQSWLDCLALQALEKVGRSTELAPPWPGEALETYLSLFWVGDKFSPLLPKISHCRGASFVSSLHSGREFNHIDRILWVGRQDGEGELVTRLRMPSK